MAIEKTIKLNVETGAAQQNTEDLTNVLKEQRAILIELEREYLEASRILNETSKSDFAGRKKATDQVKHLRDSIKDQRLSVRELSNEQTNLNKTAANTTKHHIEQGKALELLDIVTGGYLTESIHLYEEASRGVMAIGPAFTKMGKAGKTALTGIKTGIAATGIGLLIVGVGLLIAYWDDITGATEDSTKAAEDYAKKQKEIAANAKQEAKEVSKSSAAYSGLIYQLKGTNAGTKERSELISKINNQYGATLKNLSDENEFQEQLNRSVETYIALKKNEFKVNKNQELITGALEKQYDLEKKLAASNKEISDSAKSQGISFGEASRKLSLTSSQTKEYAKDLEAVNKRLQGYGLNINKLNKEQDVLTEGGKKFVATNREVAKSVTKVSNAVGDAANAEKEAAAEANKLNDERIALEDAQFKLRQELNQSAKDKEIDALIESYDAKFLIANGNAEDEKQLTEKQKEKIAAINKKYADKEIAERKEFKALKDEFTLSEDALAIQKIKDDYAIKAALAKDDADLIVLINEERDKKIIAIEEATANKKKEIQIQGVANGLSTISNLTELFAGKSQAQQKKAFKIQKAVNIATAVLDTYKAANAALASAPPPFNFVAMAATITAGLVNVKKIASTEFNGDVGTSPPPPSDAGGSGSGGAITPSFNVVGNSGINQLAQIQQQPTQAYVVSGAVTSAQSLDRNRIQNATIG